MISDSRGRRLPSLIFGLLAAFAFFLNSSLFPPPFLSAQEQPPPPQWIGLFDLKDKVGLKWIPDSRFLAIQVHRKVKGEKGSLEMIAEVGEPQYIDKNVVKGKIYVYHLVAVGADGVKSRPSVERSVRVTAGKKKVVSAPLWEGYLFTEKGVGLKWRRLAREGVLVYNVYRKEAGEGDYRLIGSSSGTAYHDQDLKPDRTYLYALTYLDTNFTESSFSTELEVVYSRKGLGKGTGDDIVWRSRRTRLVKIVTGGKVPFLRPADVALGPVTGNIYVTDTGNARVQIFSHRGTFIRSFGPREGEGSFIEHPLGLTMDEAENIYIVDASQNSVAIVTPEGAFSRWIGLPRLFTFARMGLIDTAIGPQGRLFIVDNYNNRVSIVGDDGPVRFFGEQGFQPGEFSAPTFCTFDEAGLFYLSDALNGRVQVFDFSGRFVRSFGQYRQGPGGLGRPKGVAVSGKGEIYVADSWKNTIQVFDSKGKYLSVLTDEEGKPLDLGSPNGIALDEENRIYIVERLSNRLQIREILDGT